MIQDDFDTTPLHTDSPGMAAKKSRLRNPQTKDLATKKVMPSLERTSDLQPDGTHAKLAGLFQSLALRRSTSK